MNWAIGLTFEFSVGSCVRIGLAFLKSRHEQCLSGLIQNLFSLEFIQPKNPLQVLPCPALWRLASRTIEIIDDSLNLARVTFYRYKVGI